MSFESLINSAFNKYFNRKLVVEFTMNDGISKVIFDNGYGYYISDIDLNIRDCKIIRIDPNILPSILDLYVENSLFSIPMNLCTICGINLGDSNPRQYCGKTRCYNSYV